MVININIKPAKDVCDITANGDVTEAISNKEREMLIDDDRLKNIIKKLRIQEKKVKGKSLGILDRLQPWGGIYLEYNWDDVSISWFPVKTEVIHYDIDKIDVVRHFTNNSKKAAKITADIEEDLNKIKTSWEITKKRDRGAKINYEVHIPECSGVGLPSSLIEVHIDPGQKFISSLSFMRYVIELEVIYEATLKGYVACNFMGWFKRCHRKYRAADVLKAANLPTTVASSEVIKICFYTNGELSLSEV